MNKQLLLMAILAPLSVACSENGSSTIVDRQGLARIAEGPAVNDRASTGGVSWQDIDGDGRPELIASNGYDVSSADPVPQANRVYRHESSSGLVSVDVPAFTTLPGFSSGSTWADFDNDGDLDAFVANQRDQENFLLRNDTGPDVGLQLARHGAGPIDQDRGWSYSASWVDVDNDGWVDLFVCNGGLSHAGENFLYRNLKRGQFEKIENGAIVTDVQATCACVWADYDNDGDQDLFVTSHGFAQGSAPQNRLYRNLGGFKFEVVADSVLARESDPSVAAAWGDYDNDGDLDLYVGNMFGMANRLYRNQGNGTFERIDGQAVAADGGITYGANWADVDNDGDLDLFVTNWGAANVLYINSGGGQFERSDDPSVTGAISFGASTALADYDGDGDLDLYVAHWPNAPGAEESNVLLENRIAQHNWIKVRLRGTRSNAAAIGARVEVELARRDTSRRQVRELSGASSFRSQDDLVQHFGVGSADRVTQVVVRWPSGGKEVWRDVPVNETVELVEGTGEQTGG